MVLSRQKIISHSSLSAACFGCNLTRYRIPPLLCREMHRKILMGIWKYFFFFASVDKNISRKFLKGISLYNSIILIHACVQSESRQLQATCHKSDFYCYLYQVYKTGIFRRRFHRLNSTKLNGITCKNFHQMLPN